MIDYNPYAILHYAPYFMAVWFLFVLIFGTSRYRASSFILTFSWVVYSVIMFKGLMTGGMSHIEQMGVMIVFDGVTAFALTMLLIFDKNAAKHALVLVFAVVCHSVISYILTEHQINEVNVTLDSSLFWFVYNFYSELIILTCVLQVMISHDGAIRAFRNVQILLLRSNSSSNCLAKDLFTHEKREDIS